MKVVAGNNVYGRLREPQTRRSAHPPASRRALEAKAKGSLSCSPVVVRDKNFHDIFPALSHAFWMLEVLSDRIQDVR